MPAPASALPPQVFRTEAHYRSGPRGAARAGVDCGFLLKPASDRGYRDRVLPDYVAVYVLRGRGTFTDAQRRRHRVEAGCLVQHPPKQVHSLVQEPDGNWAEFFFKLPAPLWRALTQLGSVSRDHVLRPGLDAALTQRCEALMDEVRGAPPDRSAGALARAHELLIAMHRAHQLRDTSPQLDMIAKACDWLSDVEQDYDTRDVARRLNLSYERFRKLFRLRMGMPPGEYRIRRRIDRARSLIAQDGLSNKEVAYRLAYADPFVFSKQFKRYTGMSPAAFRRAT